MAHTEKWIWLSPDLWPGLQTCAFSSEGTGKFAVAEFARDYTFDCAVAEARLRVSGDTEFCLHLNNERIVTGPVNVGGDFLFNNEPRSKHYATELTVRPGTDTLSFRARVKLSPAGINEYSRGHGGFMLEGKLTLADGRTRYIYTDENWLARPDFAFPSPRGYNASAEAEPFTPAAVVPNIWHCETAPLPPRTETIVRPAGNPIVLAPGKTQTVDLVFDRIHAGFVAVDVRACGCVDVTLECIETDSVCARYDLHFCKNDSYRGFQLESAGLYRMTAVNHSDAPTSIDAYLIATHYPAPACAKTVTDDEDLNLVLDVCRHTLKYCRQMIHLDSPKHSEPLACTGDYYIESLMTAMSFGDMRLAEFDVVRTAELLRVHDGRMFHTSYSLIWVQMLWDVYMITGNHDLLKDCADALILLLDRFETYIGENGLIETPPDFMFVDWIYIDEISMHHPPKALGQTSLCAFLFGALETAAKIFRELDMVADADRCLKKSAALKSAVNALLYDEEKQLYCDGLNTPTPEHLLYRYMPQNVEKRYYMPHSNILCALYGLCDDDTARRLIQKVVSDRDWGAVQPYFMHFLLQAVDRLGLRDELTLSVLEHWKAPVRECPKGLVEGFIAPEPTYSFDHSHAWGGTPLYSLPKHLLGLEIIDPGYKTVRLNPSLLGLECASVEVPTPYGILRVQMKQGEAPVITAPDEITILYGKE